MRGSPDPLGHVRLQGFIPHGGQGDIGKIPQPMAHLPSRTPGRDGRNCKSQIKGHISFGGVGCVASGHRGTRKQILYLYTQGQRSKDKKRLKLKNHKIIYQHPQRRIGSLFSSILVHFQMRPMPRHPHRSCKMLQLVLQVRGPIKHPTKLKACKMDTTGGNQPK